MKMFDLKVSNKGKDGKTHYNEVGVMFITEKGPVIRLHLLDKPIYAYPREQKQRTQAPKQSPVNQNPVPEYFGGEDDNIPF